MGPCFWQSRWAVTFGLEDKTSTSGSLLLCLKPLPSSFRNDLAATTAELKTVVSCFPLYGEFSFEALFQEAERGPRFLPSLLLGASRKVILQTRAAMAYRTEVTCFVRVSENEAECLLHMSLPTGAFISRHHAGGRSLWVSRPPGASAPSDDYLAVAKGFAAASAGRVVGRSSRSTPLGIVTCQSLTTFVPVRWYLSGASPFWTEDDVLSWASGRRRCFFLRVRRI